MKMVMEGQKGGITAREGCQKLTTTTNCPISTTHVARIEEMGKCSNKVECYLLSDNLPTDFESQFDSSI